MPVLVSQTVSSQSIESNGGQIKVIAIDDSYTDSYYYLHTYGTSDTIHLRKDTVTTNVGWLKFDISGVPNNATGISATLRLSFRRSMYMVTLEPEFIDDAPRVDTHYCSTNNWEEESITYNNQPSYSTTVLASKRVYRLDINDDHWFTWDVTGAVTQSFDNNKDLVSIVVEIHPNSVMYSRLWFDSKENLWDSPELIVAWSGEIPEFRSFLILPLFMMATLLAVIVYRRKDSMKH